MSAQQHSVQWTYSPLTHRANPYWHRKRLDTWTVCWPMAIMTSLRSAGQLMLARDGQQDRQTTGETRWEHKAAIAGYASTKARNRAVIENPRQRSNMKKRWKDPWTVEDMKTRCGPRSCFTSGRGIAAASSIQTSSAWPSFWWSDGWMYCQTHRQNHTDWQTVIQTSHRFRAECTNHAYL